MNLYLIKADKCDYDEYDAILVRAESEEEAIKLVSPTGEWSSDRFNARQRLTTSVVSVEGPPEVIISSFNAG